MREERVKICSCSVLLMALKIILPIWFVFNLQHEGYLCPATKAKHTASQGLRVRRSLSLSMSPCWIPNWEHLSELQVFFTHEVIANPGLLLEQYLAETLMGIESVWKTWDCPTLIFLYFTFSSVHLKHLRCALKETTLCNNIWTILCLIFLYWTV